MGEVQGFIVLKYHRLFTLNFQQPGPLVPDLEQTPQNQAKPDGLQYFLTVMEILSLREIQIAQYVAEGWSNREIAAELSLAEQTVKNHMRHIFRKLKVENRVQLAVVSSELADKISYIKEQNIREQKPARPTRAS